MAEKKYYWLKFKDNFFDLDEIKIVESMKNGKDYIIFLLKLQLKSIKTEGYLKFKDTIPYSLDMLSVITSTNIDTVKNALEVFEKLGMVERLDDGTIFMTEVQNLIGSEGSSAERVRKFRENKKQALLCNNTVIESNKDIDIDIELEKDKEKDKDINNIPYKEIIDYLNLKAKTRYKASTDSTKEKIKSRWNNGFRLNDFKIVIDKKCLDWIGTENEIYLRPETLFGNKFEGYLNQKISKALNKNSNGANSTFNNHKQRPYDGSDGGPSMNELERKLLGWDK